LGHGWIKRPPISHPSTNPHHLAPLTPSPRIVLRADNVHNKYEWIARLQRATAGVLAAAAPPQPAQQQQQPQSAAASAGPSRRSTLQGG